MRAIELLSFGDRIAAGGYRLHSRFRQAVNYLRDDCLISLVTPFVGAGPLNVVLSDVPTVDAVCVLVHSDSLQIGPATVKINAACRYHSSITIPEDFQPRSFLSGILLLKDALRKYAPPDSLRFLLDKGDEPVISTFDSALVTRFRSGVRLMREGLHGEGAQLVKGLGRGLTPSGDDFIAGFLIALNLRQSLFQENTSDVIEDVYRAAAGNNPFSTAFLRCAKEGSVFDRFKQVVGSIFSSNQDAMNASVQRLVKIGGTTGADMAAGLVFGLELSLIVS